MKLNEFNKGQVVHIVRLNQGRNVKASVFEGKVETVGRKYVTLTNGNRYEEGPDHLRESMDWGESTYLFQTLDQANEFIEKKELVALLSPLNQYFFEKYPVEVLRKIRELLSI